MKLSSEIVPPADGRKLYQYRITDQDYQLLREDLKSLKRLPKTVFERKAFVLYAAEWWRRESKEWKWEPLLESLGWDIESITSNERVDLIDKGLRAWKLDIVRTEKVRRAIASLFIQGGFPIQYVTEKDGWLPILLRKSLDAHMKKEELPLSKEHLQNHSPLIPKSLQEAGEYFTEVIKEFCVQVKQMIEGVQDLDQLENITEIFKEGWEENFPFPLGEEQATVLLKSLIQDSVTIYKQAKKNAAVRQKQTSTTDPFGAIQLKRTLFIQHNKQHEPPQKRAFYILPNEIQLADADMEKLLKGTDAEYVFFPLYAQHNARELLGEKKQKYQYEIIERQKVLKRTHRDGDDELSIENSALAWEESAYVSMLDEYGKDCATLIAGQLPYQNQSMESISPNIPYCAIKTYDTEQGVEYEYLQSSSANVKEESMLVYIPKGVTITSGEENITLLAEDTQGEYYELKGVLHLVSGEAKYRFRTNADLHDYYELQGHIVEDFTSTVYKGEIQLYKRNKLNAEVKDSVPQIDIKIQKKGERSSKSYSVERRNALGLYQMVCKDKDGYIVFSQKIGLVPKDFSYHVQADGKNCMITFDRKYVITTADPRVKIEQADNKVTLIKQEDDNLLHVKLLVEGLQLMVPWPVTQAALVKYNDHFTSYEIDPMNNKRVCILDSTAFRQIKMAKAKDEKPFKLAYSLDGHDAVKNGFIEEYPNKNGVETVELKGVLERAKGLLKRSEKGLAAKVNLQVDGKKIIEIAYVRYQLKTPQIRANQSNDTTDNSQSNCALAPGLQELGFQPAKEYLEICSNVYHEDEVQKELNKLAEQPLQCRAMSFKDPTNIVDLPREDCNRFDLENLKDSNDCWLIFIQAQGEEKLDDQISIWPTIYPTQNGSLTEKEEAELSDLAKICLLLDEKERKTQMIAHLRKMALDAENMQKDWDYLSALTRHCHAESLP
ncbi:MAG: STY4851/ECs_5259 family protein [Acinetobacter sp.]|nr:STY4851/ECs_5259 family protein [Acinetobacter sp.]